MPDARRRAVLFTLLVVVCVVGAAAAIVSAMGQGDTEQEAGGATAPRASLADARADGRPVVLFRRPKDGQVAIARLDDAGAPPVLAPLKCARVYFAGGRGLCVMRGSGFAAGYQAAVFGPDMRVTRRVDVEGIPSRARVSPDGRLGAVTMFVTGHSYADAGEFSTQTTLIDLQRGEAIADLEDFTVTRGGRQLTAIDVNFWGVTFARDSDRFYATVATGGKTYLIEGSVSARTARVLHENVECPSLSPDGTRLAYKRRTESSEKPWRLTVLDLATMRETPLAETRSIDDQAEWLDDDQVAYGTGGETWVVAADGTGEPRRVIGDADSPAAVRW
jgi:hypothetical protein